VKAFALIVCGIALVLTIAFCTRERVNTTDRILSDSRWIGPTYNPDYKPK
jgi:hypothetical protein